MKRVARDRFFFLLVGLLAVTSGTLMAAVREPDTARLAEVKAGGVVVARADWWGFAADDSTAILQAALDSGVPRIVIPRMSSPWIVHPLKVPSDIEIEVESGAIVEAIRGGFKGKRDALFQAVGASNIVFRGGNGATFRMHKRDYQNPELYERAEWRHVISLLSCENVRVEGLTLASSGGDGLYVGRSRGERLNLCKDIVVKDCIIDDNHRQGISVICVTNMLVEGCHIKNTVGTAPQAGIDFEGEPFMDVTVRNSTFENNAIGIIIMTWGVDKHPLTSFTYENLVAVSNRGSGFTATFGTVEPPLDRVRCRMHNCIEITRRGETIRYDDFWQDLTRLHILAPEEADRVQRITKWDLVERPLRPLVGVAVPPLPEGIESAARRLPLMRGNSEWVVYAAQGEEITFTAKAVPLGGSAQRRPRPVEVALYGPDGGRVAGSEGWSVLTEPREFAFTAAVSGAYLIALNPALPRSYRGLIYDASGRNAATGAPARAKPIALATATASSHFFASRGLYYFYVPAGVREFYLLAAGEGGERVQVTIYNSRGEEVAAAGEISLVRRLFVERPASSQGEIWMVQTDKSGRFSLEDYELELFGVPPLLSTSIEGLLGD